MILAMLILFTACGGEQPVREYPGKTAGGHEPVVRGEILAAAPEQVQNAEEPLEMPEPEPETADAEPEQPEPIPVPEIPTPGLPCYDSDARLKSISVYQGITWISLSAGNPQFSPEELTTEYKVCYSEQDRFGRCGTAFAVLGPEGLTEETRTSQAAILPTGWQSAEALETADAAGLYQRCHLIAYAFTGDAPDARNMITGTTQLNLNGMKPFENAILYYIRTTGNHVVYRVTPLYYSGELVARGVQLEALSVEDNGGTKDNPGISINVYIYNSQAGYTIDYATGVPTAESPDEMGPVDAVTLRTRAAIKAGVDTTNTVFHSYVLNIHTKKVHYPDCGHVSRIYEKNRQDMTLSTEELLEYFQDYTPCGSCRPYVKPD